MQARKQTAPSQGVMREEVALVTVIDLFSGAGGFTLGALQAGADVVGALEKDRDSALTYSKNLRRKSGATIPLVTDDILKIDPGVALSKWKVRSCDLLLGGPPCQGFSTHRILDSGVGDPRNELLGRYFDFVRAIRPRAFLLENVPGLLWERHADYLRSFSRKAKQAEYELRDAVVVNARDFGVPQSRKRVFILGVDGRRPLQLNWPPAPTHVDPLKKTPGEVRPAWRPASVAFNSAPSNDPNDIHMKHSAELVELFKMTPKNGGSRFDAPRTLPCHRGHDGHKDVYGRIDPRKPGPTMTTACINPSKGRFVHPTKNHGITAREAARLQTFPDDFVFHGGLMSAGRQIGNAVPVVLAEALIKPIVEAMEAQSHRGRRTPFSGIQIQRQSRVGSQI